MSSNQFNVSDSSVRTTRGNMDRVTDLYLAMYPLISEWIERVSSGCPNCDPAVVANKFDRTIMPGWVNGVPTLIRFTSFPGRGPTRLDLLEYACRHAKPANALCGFIFERVRYCASDAKKEAERKLEQLERYKPYAERIRLQSTNQEACFTGEDDARVLEALARVREHLRVPLVMYRLGQMTQQQIANELGISRSNVQRRLKEGRIELQRQFTSGK